MPSLSLVVNPDTLSPTALIPQTEKPSISPSEANSNVPSEATSGIPSKKPTPMPTSLSTAFFLFSPTQSPLANPELLTNNPTETVRRSNTNIPTASQTKKPVFDPKSNPTQLPTPMGTPVLTIDEFVPEASEPTSSNSFHDLQWDLFCKLASIVVISLYFGAV